MTDRAHCAEGLRRVIEAPLVRTEHIYRPYNRVHHQIEQGPPSDLHIQATPSSPGAVAVTEQSGWERDHSTKYFLNLK